MKKNDRIFIVGPSDDCDTLYQICSTSVQNKTFLDIYQEDNYTDFDATDNEKDAMKIAKKAAKSLGYTKNIAII